MLPVASVCWGPMIPSPGAPLHTRHTSKFVCVLQRLLTLLEGRSTLSCDHAAIHPAAAPLGEGEGHRASQQRAVRARGSNQPGVTQLLPSAHEATRLKMGDCLQGNHTGKFIPPTLPNSHILSHVRKGGGGPAYLDSEISQLVDISSSFP